MAEVCPDAQMRARIVYWGIEGAGKTTNLRVIHEKLRADHRGELRQVPTRFDPTVTYEVLPIQVGEIRGLRTEIQLVSAPGGAEQAPTRKQLLDQVDGVVLIVDSQRDLLEANVASFEELRRALTAYGRSLEELPLVIQYNKRDLADPYALEELHRKLEVRGVAVFEAVASDETGVLQTLSTISKRVVRTLRQEGPAADLETSADPRERMEAAILEEAEHPEAEPVAAAADAVEALLDTPLEIDEPLLGDELVISSVGQATRAGERAVRVPLVVSDAAGRSASLVLTIQLDALDESEG